MRAELEDAVGNQHLAKIVTGEMTAYIIQGAFGVCAERYDPNDFDRKIAKMLRVQVTAAIEFRNSVRHTGTGWSAFTMTPAASTADMSRVRPGSNSGSHGRVRS